MGPAAAAGLLDYARLKQVLSSTAASHPVLVTRRAVIPSSPSKLRNIQMCICMLLPLAQYARCCCSLQLSEALLPQPP
jgi:hypothetical protein